jgi:hypothetical protein
MLHQLFFWQLRCAGVKMLARQTRGKQHGSTHLRRRVAAACLDKLRDAQRSSIHIKDGNSDLFGPVLYDCSIAMTGTIFRQLTWLRCTLRGLWPCGHAAAAAWLDAQTPVSSMLVIVSVF